ncbi:MAG TPA: LuxR C-terminal-related transcriptional regulator [Roseomonas sp.]|jgi:DNA-binding CsgD family transcriptional regulator
MSVLHAIYRAAAEPGLWPETLGLLADRIGAGGGFLIHSGGAEHPPFIVQARLRGDLIEPYFRHYADNPYAQAFAQVRPGRVYVANQLVDVPALRRTAFHADMLVPMAVEEQLVLAHAGLTRDGSSGGISFSLARRHLDGTARALARFRRLAPHLSRALDIGLLAGRQRGAGWQVARLLDALAGAALLLDGQGRILRANAAAEALLRAGDGLRASLGGLAAATGSETRLLAAAIADAVAVAHGEERAMGGALRLTRPSGRGALLAVATPLPPPAFAPWDRRDNGARALLRIADPAAPAPLRAQAAALRAMAGLTAAEARVAALAGSGLGTPEVAALLGVSASTVKTHLAHCFDKTGARSQAALARLLASIPVG